MYRILYIGSYVYHSYVIVVTTQSNANKYKINSTYYYQVYYIKPITMNTCDPQSLTVVVLYVDSCGVQDKNCICCNTTKVGIPSRLEYQIIHGAALLYKVKGQWAPD